MKKLEKPLLVAQLLSENFLLPIGEEAIIEPKTVTFSSLFYGKFVLNIIMKVSLDCIYCLK